MRRTLFLLDGPLLLRAQLARLVEPVRAFIEHQKARGLSFHLVGVEKSGDFRSFADTCNAALSIPGDYFLPDVKYIVEQINGRKFDPETYRNRVNYGAKVVIRVGPHHILAIDVPTGAFNLAPSASHLIGFESIVRALAHLMSYRYENALIPVVLANTAASISNQPSGGILAQFVERLLNA